MLNYMVIKIYILFHLHTKSRSIDNKKYKLDQRLLLQRRIKMQHNNSSIECVYSRKFYSHCENTRKTFANCYLQNQDQNFISFNHNLWFTSEISKEYKYIENPNVFTTGTYFHNKAKTQVDNKKMWINIVCVCIYIYYYWLFRSGLYSVYYTKSVVQTLYTSKQIIKLIYGNIYLKIKTNRLAIYLWLRIWMRERETK